jgi:hypothetical protein
LNRSFDKIITTSDVEPFIKLEQGFANVDLKSKFESPFDCDIVVYINDEITNEDFDTIQRLRIIHSLYEKESIMLVH